MVCQYCENMLSAVEGSNYCSHRQPNAQTLESNAFYFASKDLSSGKHMSRFSIRLVTKGYQAYEVNGRTRILSTGNFLVIPEGHHFNSYITPAGWTEGLIIGISPEMINDFLNNVNQDANSLLTDPDQGSTSSFEFHDFTYLTSPVLQLYFDQLVTDIQQGGKDKIYFQELFYKILKELANHHKALKAKVECLSAVKSSTRQELFDRVSRAREFIDAHLDRNLCLVKIAQKAYLSPFHFLRSFHAIYGITPYQYILDQRLRKAEYLLKSLSLNVEEVMGMVGFENNRTFQRAFSKKYGSTPTAIIKAREIH